MCFRGDLTDPAIEEYRVGPLPRPATYEPVTYPKWGYPIKYSLRPLMAPGDMLSWTQFICRELDKVETVLRNLTGGYVYSPNCTARCVTYTTVLPAHRSDANARMLWVVLYVRMKKSAPLHPTGFHFRVNMKSIDPNEWSVDYVWIRNRTFSNMAALRVAYNDTGFWSAVAAAEKHEDAEVRVEGTKNNAGKFGPPPSQRGPRSFMPDGRRFKVTGRSVKWSRWSFNFGIRSSTGVLLHDIRIDEKRIVYELSLQEVLLLNSGALPASVLSMAMESGNHIGTGHQRLRPGFDCPEDATFLDAVQYVHFRPRRYRNAVCIFETDRRTPLKWPRRNGGRVASMGSLVLRTVFASDWCNYIMDFVFHANAVLEAVVSIGGFVKSQFLTEQELRRFGFQLSQQSIGNIYNHLVNFKVDLDVRGVENRFEVMEIRGENSRSGLGANGTAGETIIMHYLTRSLVRSEQAAKMASGSDMSKYYLFYNANSSDCAGKPRAYRLLPLTTSKFMLPDEKSMMWTTHQV